MFEKDDERKLISIDKIKDAYKPNELSDDEAKEIQLTLDVLCEILYEQLKEQ